MKPVDTLVARRYPPDQRMAQILAAAVQLATTSGYHAVTRDAVAEAANVSPALITHYFLASVLLREAVMQEAIRLELPEIIAAGLASRCPIAMSAPMGLKQQAVDCLLAVTPAPSADRGPTC